MSRTRSIEDAVGKFAISTNDQVALVGRGVIDDVTATTIFTNPNFNTSNGAFYRVDTFLRVNTVDGGTTPTAEVNVLFTEGASARNQIVAMFDEAGVSALTVDMASVGTYYGSTIIKADQNTAIQYQLSEGGTPDELGDFDFDIRLTRLS